MPTLIAGVLAVVVLYSLLQMFRAANPIVLARVIKIGGGVVALAVAAFTGLKGELAVAVPLGIFGAGLLGWSPFGASDSVMFCTTTGGSNPYMTCNKSATDGLFASRLSCVFPESCTAGTSMSRSGGAAGAAMMMLTPPSAIPAVKQYRAADRMTLLGATVIVSQRT